MTTTYRILLSGLLALAPAVHAETATPQQAVTELGMQLNSRFVDALIGPVDYDFTYVQQGDGAYPLAALLDFQTAERQAPRADTTGWRRYEGIDSTKVAPTATAGSADTSTRARTAVDSSNRPTSPTRAVVDSADLQTGRPDASGTVRVGIDSSDFRPRPTGGTELASDPAGEGIANPDPNPDLSTAARAAEAFRKARETYLPPFVPQDRPTVGASPVRLRFPGDRRGDPSSFDLSRVDRAVLQQRPLPPDLRDIEGVEVGVIRPTGRPSKAPGVTRIEQEHGLAERRVMRLDLRDFYARLSTEVELKLQVEEVQENGRQTVARVRWWFLDWKSQTETEARTDHLALTQTVDGWRIEQSWKFIEKVMASR